MPRPRYVVFLIFCARLTFQGSNLIHSRQFPGPTTPQAHSDSSEAFLSGCTPLVCLVDIFAFLCLTEFYMLDLESSTPPPTPNESIWTLCAVGETLAQTTQVSSGLMFSTGVHVLTLHSGFSISSWVSTQDHNFHIQWYVYIVVHSNPSPSTDTLGRHGDFGCMW